MTFQADLRKIKNKPKSIPNPIKFVTCNNNKKRCLFQMMTHSLMNVILKPYQILGYSAIRILYMEIVGITRVFMFQVTLAEVGIVMSIGHDSRNSYFELTNFDITYQLAAVEFEQSTGVSQQAQVEGT